MLLELGIAVGGGILNALAGSAADDAAERERRRQEQEIEKRKQAALSILKENIIDPDELDTMLDNVNRLFNNRLINTLNSTALRSRGIANNTAVKGVVASGIESQRLANISDAYSKSMVSNASVRQQAANVIANTPIVPGGDQHNFLNDFVSGTLAAAPMGMELGKMFNEPQAPTLPNGDIYKPNSNSTNLQNPFLNKFKIEDADITNFGYSKFWNN